MEVIKPLPESLTKSLPYPASVANLDDNISVGQLLDMVFDLLDTVDVANRDRRDAAQLTQPEPSAGTPE